MGYTGFSIYGILAWLWILYIIASRRALTIFDMGAQNQPYKESLPLLYSAIQDTNSRIQGCYQTMDTLTLRLVYFLIYWSLFSLNLFLFPTYLFLFLSIYFPSISFSFSCYYIYYPLPTDLSQGLPQWFYFFIFSYLTGRANIQTGPKEKQHVSSPYYDSLSPTAQVVGRACIVLDWKTLSKMEVYIYTTFRKIWSSWYY